jgi:hypothetical protein
VTLTEELLLLCAANLNSLPSFGEDAVSKFAERFERRRARWKHLKLETIVETVACQACENSVKAVFLPVNEDGKTFAHAPWNDVV